MSRLLCKECKKGPLSWVGGKPNDDMTNDMKCNECGALYHGMEDYTQEEETPEFRMVKGFYNPRKPLNKTALYRVWKVQVGGSIPVILITPEELEKVYCEGHEDGAMTPSDKAIDWSRSVTKLLLLESEGE